MPRFALDGGHGAGRFALSAILNLVWRILQLVAGIVVIAFYASDLNGHQKPDKYSRSRWVFALVVGILGTISALVYGIAGLFMSYHNTSMGFAWEWILTILWAAVAGLFSSMYLHYHPLIDVGVHRERVAAGFDLANLLLWGLSAIAATVAFFLRSRRSLHTGRAKV